ncbi:hypothetical protein, partial [Serratia fonticola]
TAIAPSTKVNQPVLMKSHDTFSLTRSVPSPWGAESSCSVERTVVISATAIASSTKVNQPVLMKSHDTFSLTRSALLRARW